MKKYPSFPWDHYSDQPHVLKRTDKKALRKGHGWDYLKLISTNLIYFPYLFFKFYLKRNMAFDEIEPTVSTDFYGLCVNLDKGKAQYALVEELGVKSLQIRVFLNDMENINAYVDFAQGFGGDKNILITIIQDREHIEDPELLAQDIAIIFQKFEGISDEFMIGNAINRIKWGFISMEEYLRFYHRVQEVRDTHFPQLRLIGSSIIDFEYHFTIRTLFNGYPIHYDKVASLLYVDRRGSPYATQMGIFDFNNKIKFLDTIVQTSPKCDKHIYLTETNWPLTDTAPYAPTSELECVREEIYNQYMIEYFKIAKESGKIDKVYWHQLIAPGYGLVDNRGEKIRKTEAFESFGKLLKKLPPSS